MSEKKIGILKNQNELKRKQGNIIPEKTFEEKSIDRMQKKKIEFRNQKGSIKVPLSTKAELNALKDINKTKTDYETIQMLIDSFVPTMDTAKQKRFRILTEEE
ncbi:hypothetical protein ACJQ40_002929 [Enterococcus faecium]